MKKKSAVVGLVFLSLLLQSCHSTNSQTVEIQNGNYTPPTTEITPNPGTKIQVSSNEKVEFKGVSFSYNPKVFGEVKAEEIAEYFLDSETDRPWTDQAQHLNFIFKNRNKTEKLHFKYFL